MTARDLTRDAARALVPRHAVNALLRVLRIAVGPIRFDALMGRGHRYPGYRLLRGSGIEIGALHAPASLPKGCVVTYVDAITAGQAGALFPEIDANRLVPVDVVTDLDTQGLSGLETASFDFAIMNHVVEHVANPVAVVGELFRVVRVGGLVALSAPDMRFSFDRQRPLTSEGHLLAEYRDGVKAVTDEHYAEFVKAISPNVSPSELTRQMAIARERREHAHVWTSDTFAAFLYASLRELEINALKRYESGADRNQLEHFSVWEKQA